MNAIIIDRNAILAVSPMALFAYARTSGWAKVDTYGDHSDVYAGPSLPELLIPRTRQLGDYGLVVERLIGIFARVAEVSENTIYNDLLTADRDVIRARVSDGYGDGSVAIDSGVKLVNGARDLVLAAACSLHHPRPLYRTVANREANDLLRQMRLGQTEHGSFVVTLLTPAIPAPTHQPIFQDLETADAPIARKVTRRLEQALSGTRHAIENAVSGETAAFAAAVNAGVSANLCEALADLAEPFAALEISITWARTRPMPKARQTVTFTGDDSPILRDAAHSFRNRAPRPDVSLFGSVQVLHREETERDSTIVLYASVDGNIQPVRTTLIQSDYDRAIQAHAKRAPVIVEGDLERIGQRWHLHRPSIVTVISGADDPGDEDQQ